MIPFQFLFVIIISSFASYIFTYDSLIITCYFSFHRYKRNAYIRTGIGAFANTKQII